MKLFKRRILTFQFVSWVDYGVGRQKIGFISQHDEEPCLFSIATGTALGPTQPRTDTVGFPSEGGKEMKWLRSADDYPPPSTAHVSMRGLLPLLSHTSCACYAYFRTGNILFNFNFRMLIRYKCRSQWPRGLRRRSAAAHLLRSWVPIPPGAWMFVCCECCVLSGRGLYDELITCPEEFYRLWCVVACDLETSRMRRPWPALSRSATEIKITYKWLN